MSIVTGTIRTASRWMAMFYVATIAMSVYVHMVDSLKLLLLRTIVSA